MIITKPKIILYILSYLLHNKLFTFYEKKILNTHNENIIIVLNYSEKNVFIFVVASFLF